MKELNNYLVDGKDYVIGIHMDKYGVNVYYKINCCDVELQDDSLSVDGGGFLAVNNISKFDLSFDPFEGFILDNGEMVVTIQKCSR